MKKKKLLSVLCAMSMLVSPQMTNVHAVGNVSEPAAAVSAAEGTDEYTEVTVDGLKYNIYSDHAEVADSQRNDLPENIVIPETVSGKPVTKLGQGLMFKRKIISVSLPDTITEFALSPMFGCENLESVKLPAHIRELPISTFYSCKSLKTVELPDELEIIGPTLFQHCDSLEKITIPASVSSISTMAFKECASLKEVTILNPDCKLTDQSNFICNTCDETAQTAEYSGVIRGYSNSTAQKYAENYGYKFESINSTPSDTAASSITEADIKSAFDDMTTIIMADFHAFSGEEMTYSILSYSLPSNVIKDIEFDVEFDSPDIIPEKSFLVTNQEDRRYIYTLRVRIRTSENAKSGEHIGKYIIKKVVDINGNDITQQMKELEGTTSGYVRALESPSYDGSTAVPDAQTTSVTSTTTTTTTTTTVTTSTTSRPVYIGQCRSAFKSGAGYSQGSEEKIYMAGYSIPGVTDYFSSVEFEYIFEDKEITEIGKELLTTNENYWPSVTVNIPSDFPVGKHKAKVVVTKAIDKDGNDVTDKLPWKEKTITYPVIAAEAQSPETTTTAPETTTTTTTTVTTTVTTTAPVLTPGGYTLGDADSNGIIDGRDATVVLTEYAKTSTGSAPTFTAAQTKAADVNLDGIIDGRDASILLAYYAKISTSQPVSLDDYAIKK